MALNRQTSAYPCVQVLNQRAHDCALLAKPLRQRPVVEWSDIYDHSSRDSEQWDSIQTCGIGLVVVGEAQLITSVVS